MKLISPEFEELHWDDPLYSQKNAKDSLLIARAHLANVFI